MRLLTSLVFCALLFGTPATADNSEKQPDPWIGKKRGVIVEMLGAPDKAKGGGARETLTYRFVRVSSEAAALPPGIELVAVPGVEGAVGRLHRGDSPAVAITGTQIDNQGRLAGGGVGTEQSHNISWSKKDGKKVSSSEEDRSAVLGKCTIKFKLNNGRVSEWSVSSKDKDGKK